MRHGSLRPNWTLLWCVKGCWSVRAGGSRGEGEKKQSWRPRAGEGVGRRVGHEAGTDVRATHEWLCVASRLGWSKISKTGAFRVSLAPPAATRVGCPRRRGNAAAAEDSSCKRHSTGSYILSDRFSDFSRNYVLSPAEYISWPVQHHIVCSQCHADIARSGQ